MGSGKLIRYAISKYGIENFVKEILHIFDNELDMNAKEKELVIINEMSYNLCDGGNGGFDYINRNEELRICKNKKARKSTDKIIFEKYGVINPGQLEHVKNINSKRCKKLHEEGKIKIPDWTGKKHSQETKEKIGLKNSIHQQGFRNSQFGTCWVTNGRENKKIKKEKLDEFIELGYHKGRVIAGLV